MRTATTPRPLAAAAAAAAVLVLGAGLMTSPAQAAPAPAAMPGRALTTILLRVQGCEGCLLSAHSRSEGQAAVFGTRAKKVRDGRVRFTVPTARTVGLSIAVVAPFEGATLANSEVVLGYRGHPVGSSVTPAAAAAATRGSVCFAGTSQSRLRLTIQIVPVRIRGNGGPVTAAAAFATTTQASLSPSYRTFGGYQGSRGVPACKASS